MSKYEQQSPQAERRRRAKAWVEQFARDQTPDQFMPYQPETEDLVTAFLAGNFDGRGETE